MSIYYSWLCATLHRVTLVSCLILLVVLLFSQVGIVIMRYCFGVGYLELQDFSTYAFASLVTLSIPVALVADRHVRVDVLRERQTPDLQNLMDNAGVLLLLLPVFLLSIYLAYPDIAYAWKIREGSRETGGLGGVYIVKTLFPVSCVLMVLQGINSILLRRTA